MGLRRRLQFRHDLRVLGGDIDSEREVRLALQGPQTVTAMLATSTAGAPP